MNEIVYVVYEEVEWEGREVIAIYREVEKAEELVRKKSEHKRYFDLSYTYKEYPVE